MNGRRILFVVLMAALAVGTIVAAQQQRNGQRHQGHMMNTELSGTQRGAHHGPRPGWERCECDENCDGDGFRGRPHHRPPIGRILERAGQPLTDAQKEALRELGRGPETREEKLAILTPEQITALEEAAEARRVAHLERLGAVLGDAGVPLDPGQIAAIEALEPGHRGAMGEILTDAQKDALREARPLRGEGFGTSDLPSEQIEDPIGAEKATGVEDDVPAAFTVGQNFPNPFNPTTTIDYTLAEAGNVHVDIFNQRGQRIDTLVSGHQNAGPHSVVWDASPYAAGLYLYRVTSAGHTETRKMTLVK